MTRVYETDNPNFADVVVDVVSSPVMADLLVYRRDDARSEAHDETVWTFVNTRENAHLIVYFAPKTLRAAHLKICYVNSRMAAGWTRRHKLKGKLKGLGRHAFHT
ncbi:DUF6150 family protein [Oceanibium sediminis]|uniref:DUF6150 family protein n=1 Tax=Oceanibium sediminis TaxID=2026339 RepID=UPI000DD2E369|nr:DUF6150 family protein [Oceanibium sediminis]